MKILIDIGHPAHVHFFRKPIQILKAHGHNFVITSRHKEMTLDLLDDLEIDHIPLTAQGKSGIWSLGKELVWRDLLLRSIVRETRPDILAAIGGIFIAQVGSLTRTPSLVFYDTENAHLQNYLTYPFASRVIVPRSYQSWVPKKRHARYAGYHELSYLHPKHFKPNITNAIANGLREAGDNFLIRTVSWKASHDIGDYGWTIDLLRKAVKKLARLGHVLISAEGPLPEDMEHYRYRGKASEVHHVMAFCRAFLGESATMASECAVLGVPAIYAARTGRGYTDEQEQRYGLVLNRRDLRWSTIETAIDEVISRPPSHWKAARETLLEDTIDVAAYVAQCIEEFPKSPDTLGS